MTATGIDADAGSARQSPVAVVEGTLEWLATIDVEALDDHERLGLVAGLERLKGGASAAQAGLWMPSASPARRPAPRTQPAQWGRR